MQEYAYFSVGKKICTRAGRKLRLLLAYASEAGRKLRLLLAYASEAGRKLRLLLAYASEALCKRASCEIYRKVVNDLVFFKTGKSMTEFYMPLNQLVPGSKAKVKSLCSEGSLRRRMLDLGLITDTIVEALHKSPAGDPVAYLIRGAVIALRSEEASKVMVEAMPLS